MEAILPTGQTQMLSMVSDFSFNWHNNYVYADDAAPLLPKGTILQDHLVARQHHRQQEQPRSESVGRLGRSHGRRDGARVGEHHLHGRRGLQGRSREAQGRDRDDHERPAAAVTVARTGAAAQAPPWWCCRRPAPPVVFRSEMAAIGWFVSSSSAWDARRGRRRRGRWRVSSSSRRPDSCRCSRASDSGPERHRRVRRLVSEPGRHLHAARRLLQSQPEADARHPGRPEQSHRARRTRPGTADALPAAPQWGVFTIKVPKDFGDKR